MKQLPSIELRGAYPLTVQLAGFLPFAMLRDTQKTVDCTHNLRDHGFLTQRQYDAILRKILRAIHREYDSRQEV